LDHHGIQILLFSLMLLGLARGGTWWGHALAGAAMAASITIGLDAILLVVAILGWLGVDWALGRDENGRGLVRAAAGIAGTALVLFPLDNAPSQWFAARCDANSIVYLSAFLAIAAAFAMLAAGTSRLAAATPAGTFALRLAAGAVLAALVAGGLFAAFPECAAGPYGAMSPELRTRWLVNVHEARGLLTMVETVPALWLSALAYSLLLVLVGAVVVWRRGSEYPALLAVYATFVLSVAAMFLQYRALRIGVFASIPLCVAFAAMSWQWLERRFASRRIVAGVLQAAIVLVLLSPTWLLAGTTIFPEAPGAASAGGGAAGRPGRPDLPQWKREAIGPFCNRQDQFAVLAALPKGLVMNDINSGPSILVFTDHAVIGGPYHRNERAILDMTDFFETDEDNPARIARERGIDYVAWCDPGNLDGPGYAGNPALAARLARGETPDWLQRLSSPDDRLQVLRVVPQP
ncbi:MAG: hypothetical protein VYD64_05275, partial [Pseudomonadota bacterium]|nr:hypothetical protein [Pseudomonadota bacterium]